MRRSLPSRLVPSLALGLVGLALPRSPAPAQEKTAVPAGGAVNITVASAAAAAPPVSIILHERHGHVTPFKSCCAHTGGGLIEVVSPAPDTVVLTMSGAAVADASMTFDLEQCFEVSFDDPKVKRARLSVEGRVVGLLRGMPAGCAEYTDACASVGAANQEFMAVCVPPHSACGCQALAVNDHDGPRAIPVLPGKYTLHQTFALSAQSHCCLCKRPSAEFAPDPAIDPLWISYWEPFHGVKKDAFGFQVTLRVVPETEGGNGKKEEQLPPPMDK
jgi:hypothetical protein